MNNIKYKVVLIGCLAVLLFVGIFQFSFNNNNIITDTHTTPQQHTASSSSTTTRNNKDVLKEEEETKGKNIGNTIFISLAAYRDVMCSDTINYIYLNSDHPEKIYIGLVDQGSEKLDPETNRPDHPQYPVSTCYRGLKVPIEWMTSNVRYQSLTIQEAKGPTLARYHASKLYRGETYYMQIDSHIRFIKSWDSLIISNHWALRGIAPSGKNGIPRAILTHYPLPYEQGTEGLPHDDQTHVPNLCKGIFNSRGLMTFNSFILSATKVPKECPFVAAGFFFGSAEFLETVPYDPYLPNMFEGEEILHTIRLWTAGYRFYAPTMNICYHFYMRKDSPKFWEDNREYYVSMNESVDRARYILGLDHPDKEQLNHPKYQDISRYDIHDKSLVKGYWDTFDIDPIEKTHDFNKWCK